jgi:hypothetical protein
MKQPECPPRGKVMVLCNSFFEEWKPDIVPIMFDNTADAEEWIRAKLEEEPGDLYAIVSIESYFWAKVSICKRVRKK